MELHYPLWLERLKRPLLLGLVAAIVSAGVTLFMPNYYKSEARVLPLELKNSSSMGNLAAAAAVFGVNMPGGDAVDANFVDIVNSRTVREQLLHTEFTFPMKAWRFGTAVEHRVTLFKYLGQVNIDRAVQNVGFILTVSRDAKTRIISISAETLSPELSQQIVKKVLHLLEVFVQQKGRTRGSAKAQFAEARLGEACKERDAAGEALRIFLGRNRNYNISSDPSVRIMGMRLEADYKLREQLVSSLAVSREQALMDEKNDMPILNILDPANLPVDKSRPVRSNIVFLVFILMTMSSAVWLYRDYVRSCLLSLGVDSSTKNS